MIESQILTPELNELVGNLKDYMCLECGITREKLESKSRKRDVATARFLLYPFLYSELNLSLKKVGQLFSDRDHSSVIHGIESVKDWSETDKYFNKLLIKVTKGMIEIKRLHDLKYKEECNAQPVSASYQLINAMCVETPNIQRKPVLLLLERNPLNPLQISARMT